MDSLATVHTYSAEALPFGRELAAAEEEAKKNRKNVGRPRRFVQSGLGVLIGL
jgi:hypothetical protein